MTGVEPALAELQSAALPLGYTVIYYQTSAERFELSLTASKTVVLPVRRNGNIVPLTRIELVTPGSSDPRSTN